MDHGGSNILHVAAQKPILFLLSGGFASGNFLADCLRPSPRRGLTAGRAPAGYLLLEILYSRGLMFMTLRKYLLKWERLL